MIKSFCEIMPVQHYDFFVRLGKLDPWLFFEDTKGMDTDSEFKIRVDWLKLRKHGLEDSVSKHLCVTTLGKDGKVSSYLSLVWIDAFASFMTGGPKVFDPSEEQFESMQHVKMTIPFSDYRAPFPCMIVMVPKSCSAALADQYGVERIRAAKWVIIRQRLDGTLVIGVRMANIKGGIEFTHFLCNPFVEATLEEAVAYRPTEYVLEFPEEHAMCYQAARAALNLSLMLTHYGCRADEPVDPVSYARHRRKASLARFAPGDCLAIKMTQNITVRETRKERLPGPGEATGRTIAPHWVSGYWRRQIGYREVLARGETPKQMFIKPYLTRRDDIIGDLSETKVIYKGK